MNTSIDNLLLVSGNPLHSEWAVSDECVIEPFGVIGRELLSLLRQRNGFFAFESSLHVYPLAASSSGLDLRQWNDRDTWKASYGSSAPEDALFFAQDIFGNQFGICNNRIIIFYSESAESETIARSVEEWAEVVLSDWKGFTGYDLSHEWQLQLRESLAEDERLIPKIPFVLGGKYDVDNLYKGQIVAAMRFRGSLVGQISRIPDGANIKLRVE